MLVQRLRKVGNSYVVTVPREEVDAQGLREGDLVALEVRPVELRPALSPEVRRAFEASWERNEAGYRRLAGR